MQLTIVGHANGLPVTNSQEATSSFQGSRAMPPQPTVILALRETPTKRTYESWPKDLWVVYCRSISPHLSLSPAPRVWNHSEVVLVLSPPTSHLLNEPSIDRRHFVVSRFPSHLAAVSLSRLLLVRYYRYQAVRGDLIFPLPILKIVQRFLPRRAVERE